MNRFGCALLALFLIVATGFVLLMRPGSDSPPQRVEPVSTSSSPAGALIVPVAGVGTAQLADSFGDAREDGARGHGAIDIMAPRGTAVLAAAEGTVEKLFESALGGHTIYIRTTDGRQVHYYAHLDTYAPDLREGIIVDRGQRIATVGFSGDASEAGPHLHFEVKEMAPGEKWYQGRGINPYPLLAAGAAAR